MGYRINYRITSNKEGNIFRFLFFTGLFFLTFLFLVDRYWPEGAAVLRSGYGFVKETVSGAVWNRSAEEMMTAQSVADAVSCFFKNLLT